MPASSQRCQSREAVSAGKLNLTRALLGCALAVDVYLVSGVFSRDHLFQALSERFGLNARKGSTNALAR